MYLHLLVFFWFRSCHFWWPWCYKMLFNCSCLFIHVSFKCVRFESFGLPQPMCVCVFVVKHCFNVTLWLIIHLIWLARTSIRIKWTVIVVLIYYYRRKKYSKPTTEQTHTERKKREVIHPIAFRSVKSDLWLIYILSADSYR